MDRFSGRTTIGLASGLLFAGVFLYIAIQTVAKPINPPLHCTCHAHSVTCTPATNP